jgi:hypothetical protein
MQKTSGISQKERTNAGISRENFTALASSAKIETAAPDTRTQTGSKSFGKSRLLEINTKNATKAKHVA